MGVLALYSCVILFPCVYVASFPSCFWCLTPPWVLGARFQCEGVVGVQPRDRAQPPHTPIHLPHGLRTRAGEGEGEVGSQGPCVGTRNGVRTRVGVTSLVLTGGAAGGTKRCRHGTNPLTHPCPIFLQRGHSLPPFLSSSLPPFLSSLSSSFPLSVIVCSTDSTPCSCAFAACTCLIDMLGMFLFVYTGSSPGAREGPSVGASAGTGVGKGVVLPPLGAGEVRKASKGALFRSTKLT